MKLNGVIESTVITALQNPPNSQLFPPDLVAKLVERYRFVEFPRTAEQFKADVSLLFGRFKETTIDKVTIYNDGLFVTGAVDTTMLDSFVSDLMDGINVYFGVDLPSLKRQTFYNSRIEVVLNPGFDNVFKKVGDLAARLTEMVSKHGLDTSPYQGMSFGLYTEKIEHVAPGRFVVEPRAGRSLTENCFFSEAPVTTKEHCELLEALEQLF